MAAFAGHPATRRMEKRFGTTLRAQPTPPGLDLDPDAGRWHLFVAHAPDRANVGHAYALTTRPTALGREPDPHAEEDLIRLADDRVSRRHAVVVVGAQALHVTDAASTNGLFVDGRRTAEAHVRAGAVLRLGDTVLVTVRGALGLRTDESGLGMVGRSPALATVRSLLRRVGPSALPVLIGGETGTGKELIARAVHAESQRSGPFVAINCAALPAPLVESLLFGHRKGAYTGASAEQEGAFGHAHGGTLFLDEVGELALEAQPKLLRVLEDGEVTPVGSSRPARVDVRVVTATNVPLDEAVRAGRFREDLYARLAGVKIAPPPVRERREDIVLLFEHFLGEAARGRPPSPEFAEGLLLHPWPQNVRELRKLAERLQVLHPGAPRWEAAMLDLAPPAPSPHAPAEPASEESWAHRSGPPSREGLIELLVRFEGNVSRLAEHVHRNRKQVYRWMDELGIERNTGRS
jgi:DNA-binding NtrC family response regulator